MPTTVSSREFNQDTSRAKKAALVGPVFITDRGRPSHVLLTMADYLRLVDRGIGIGDLLGEPPGVEQVAMDLPVRRELPRPADFD